MIARLDEALGRRISLRSLVLLRHLVGPLVAIHLWGFLDDARHGRQYRDTFHEPFWWWYPEVPRAAYVALLVVGMVGALCMSLGVRQRAANVVAFAVVAYNLFLSTTHLHNNRAYLVIVLGILTAVPGEEGPAWPLWLLRTQATVVYGASGLSKLLDADWFGGRVTWLRVVRFQDRIPEWAVGTLTDKSFHTGAAKVIVLTELFLAVGLWLRGTRRAAIVLAICFHVAIQVTANVETFSLLCLSALVIWSTPRAPSDDRPTVEPAATSRR